MGYRKRCVFVVVGAILVTLLRHFYSGKGYQKLWTRSSGSAWENQVSPNPGLLLVENNMVTDEPKNVQLKILNPGPLLVGNTTITDEPKNAQVKLKPLVNRMTTRIWGNTNSHSNRKTTSAPARVKTNQSRLLNRSITATPAWVEAEYRCYSSGRGKVNKVFEAQSTWDTPIDVALVYTSAMGLIGNPC